MLLFLLCRCGDYFGIIGCVLDGALLARIFLWRQRGVFCRDGAVLAVDGGVALDLQFRSRLAGVFLVGVLLAVIFMD